jgi:dGTPase
MKSSIIMNRIRLEEIENQTLAPYAIKSKDTKGREYPEDEPAYRTVFQRDRDRILHTTAFRRLEDKTQVFVVIEGDYYRTRMTHTLEVSQIGRTIARALAANEDLVEAICLAHDLGHPPFGHAGERILNRLMASHGGFEHNRQSLRIVTKLEKRYLDFPGLNLTWEVREGIVKHETDYDISQTSEYDPEKRASLEAQITNFADELAYTAHDLDDGLRSELITPPQLAGMPIWEMLLEKFRFHESEFDELYRHLLIRYLIDTMVTDLLDSTNQRLQASNATSAKELQLLSNNMVALSDKTAEMFSELKSFLYQNFYNHYQVTRMQVKADHILSDLFEIYTRHPEILPLHIQSLADTSHYYRTLCDYIAGMTDRFALQEHNKLFNPYTHT